MRRKVKFTRRQFVQMAAVGVAAGPLIGCGVGKIPWRFLTEQEASTLAALCDRIIPEDQFPGGAGAGAVNYIDLQLVGAYKRFRGAYRRGLAGIDEVSRTLYGKRFRALSATAQDEMLKALEAGRAPGDARTQKTLREFFGLLVSHTMQGFYGDPRHGGNRKGISWQMLDLPYPPIRGRLHYDLTKPGKTGPV
jgi:gluconate 2-dehydrogenase gamma chain